MNDIFKNYRTRPTTLKGVQLTNENIADVYAFMIAMMACGTKNGYHGRMGCYHDT